MSIGKKGSNLDLFFVTVFIVIFAIVILFTTYVKDQLFTPIGAVLNDASSTQILNNTSSAFNVFDFAFMFLAIGGGIASIILAVMVPMHPMFFFINIVVIVALFLVVPTLSNIVREIWIDPNLSAYQSTYPMMLALVQYLPYFFLGFSFLLSVVMYAKSRQDYG